MTTMMVSIENNADINNIVLAVRQLKGVAEVDVQKGVAFEHIPGLSYTHEECMADIFEAEENYVMGQMTSSGELKKRVATW
ncbi:MAG: hypothetical protein FWF09_08970 [Bacteroidales bacterium]|nr:hypothetical protein [Bacteroidales bacterium]